jgi:F-type H+-transporting ATPase subunit delta
MMMLEVIAKQYSIIYDYDKNIQVAKVTTAVALTKELEDKIQAKIVEITGNSAGIENIVNPTILGGFILRVGDVQYDASISNQLNQLRREFDNSHYIPQI